MPGGIPMSDTTDLAAQLAALQSQLAALRPAPSAASPWASAAPAPAQILGVSVPIKVWTPAGSLRVYLSLPAESAASPAALNAALESLAAAGLPLDTWEGKSSSWGGHSKSNRGGWSR